MWRMPSRRNAVKIPLKRLRQAYSMLGLRKRRIGYAMCSLDVALRKCSFDSMNISAKDRNNMTPRAMTE